MHNRNFRDNFFQRFGDSKIQHKHSLYFFSGVESQGRKPRSYRLVRPTLTFLSCLATSRVYIFIIQQIVTLSKYGHDALDICHP